MTAVQRVTNCILVDKNKQAALVLQKPRRGWWVAPGGKMESLETIEEAVIREYREETGLQLIQPKLIGVFTMVVKEKEDVVDEWMMFTFYAEQYKGELLDESPEGLLQWKPLKDVPSLPKAEGDNLYFNHIIEGKTDVLIRKFYYTLDYELISYE